MVQEYFEHLIIYFLKILAASKMHWFGIGVFKKVVNFMDN